MVQHGGQHGNRESKCRPAPAFTRCARRRAKDVSRSPVVALNLASKSLAEIVDTLLAWPRHTDWM